LLYFVYRRSNRVCFSLTISRFFPWIGPRTAFAASTMNSTSISKNLHLEPVAGPNLAALEVAADKPFVIGRQSVCEGVLSDAAVSRRHCQFTHKAGTWLLTDLDSRHGTYLNGIRLEPGSSSPVSNGDQVRIGPWTLRVGAPLLHTLLHTTRDDSASTMNRVHRVPSNELSLRAQHRLELLIDCAASITAATSEPQMADAVLDALIAGTGFPHAAFIRRIGTGEGTAQIEVLASRSPVPGGQLAQPSMPGGGPLSNSSAVSRASGLRSATSSPAVVGVPSRSVDQVQVGGQAGGQTPTPNYGAAPPSFTSPMSAQAGSMRGSQPGSNPGSNPGSQHGNLAGNQAGNQVGVPAAIPAEQLSFSRSLIESASHGQVVRLDEAGVQDYGQSVVQLGIQAAICAPVMLDNVPIAYLYLDARRAPTKPGFGFTKPSAWSIQADAPAFCQAVARICGLALSNLQRIELGRRQHQLEADLDAAREVQRLIMPAAEGSFGTVRYALRSKPGRFVAGDLIDIFQLADGKVAVFLGDVSGKGIDAAILMATAQAHLNASLKHNPDPAAALTEVNRHMASHIKDGRFISLWLGIIDPRPGSLTFVDAGHGHWLVKPAGMPPARIESTGGFPIGIEAGTLYVNDTIAFPPGSRLVLYSDGLVEQQSPEGDCFGLSRAIAAFTQTTAPTTDVASLFASLAMFAAPPVPGGKTRTVDDIALSDDVTVASIESMAESMSEST